MSDLVLRTATKAQLTARRVTGTMGRVIARTTDEERGQDTIEYLGVLIVVAAVILMVSGVIPQLSSTVSKGVSNLITAVFSSNGGGGAHH